MGGNFAPEYACKVQLRWLVGGSALFHLVSRGRSLGQSEWFRGSAEPRGTLADMATMLCICADGQVIHQGPGSRSRENGDENAVGDPMDPILPRSVPHHVVIEKPVWAGDAF